MANTWFQFRQFRVEQDRCAMKVSTDACLFGAWAPIPGTAQTLLDVGTGTGLLALMAAQRLPALRVTAIELDPPAAEQAAANATASLFADRIVVHAADARTWHPPHPFDALICNPPFFHRSLRSPDSARTTARHGDALELHDLLNLMERTLAPNGAALTLLPADRAAAWTALLQRSGWGVDEALLVCPNDRKAPNRWMGRCRRGALAAEPQGLTLYAADGRYTAAAAALLAPFYPGLPERHEKTGP